MDEVLQLVTAVLRSNLGLEDVGIGIKVFDFLKNFCAGQGATPA